MSPTQETILQTNDSTRWASGGILMLNKVGLKDQHFGTSGSRALAEEEYGALHTACPPFSTNDQNHSSTCAPLQCPRGAAIGWRERLCQMPPKGLIKSGWPFPLIYCQPDGTCNLQEGCLSTVMGPQAKLGRMQ